MVLTARTRRRVNIAAVVLGLVAAVALVSFVIQSLLTKSGPARRHTVHQIALMKPPPPPPPPKEEKPPEMKKEEVKIKPPEVPPETPPQAEQPPPGSNLGVDAEGTAGSDGFGLQANKGGRDLLALGVGGSGERSRFAAFASRLQRFLQGELARNANLLQGEYRVELKIWLAADGAIERVELAQPTGNSKTDERLRQAFAELPRLHERLPESMPQPVRLRITSRSAG